MDFCSAKILVSRNVDFDQAAAAHKMVDYTGIKTADEPEKADFFLVLGGDGFMLRMIHKYQNFLDKPFLGVNFGTKGFLMTDKKEFKEAVKEKSFQIYEFPLIKFECVGDKRSERKLEGFAVNDVYIERMSQLSSKLKILVNGETFISEVQADGVIVSTALGSTAYNLSAGGPAIFPAVKVMTLNATAVHAPIPFRPLVLPLDNAIEILVNDPKTRPSRLVYDGIEFDSVVSAKITCDQKKLKLIFWKNHNFVQSFAQKLLKN